MTGQHMTAQTEQCMNALARANTVRIDRSRLKHAIHDTKDCSAGCRELATLLVDPPACLSSLRIEEALMWVWRLGPVSVARCMDAASCSPYKRIGDMTGRQRDRVVDVLLDVAVRRAA